MAVRIRLKRKGSNKRPFYRIVVAESANARNGKSIEEIGVYDPTKDPIVCDFNEERLNYWISQGAKSSDTVHRLLANKGILPKIERKSSNIGVSKKDLKKQAE